MSPKALPESEQSVTSSTVDSYRSNQHPPLWLATKNGREDEVELQLSMDGWDKTMIDPDGRTALWWAVSIGKARLVELLLAKRKFNISDRPSGHFKLLHEAVLSKNIAITRLLLDQDGLDVNVRRKSRRGATPLHLATTQGLEEMVKLLLAHPGVDVNARDDSGGTPLHVAADKGSTKILVLLLARLGIDVNSQDRSNETPLHVAVRRGHIEIVKLLLARADIDLAPRKSPRSTPLYLAARNGHEDLVDVLLHTPGSETMLGHGQGSHRGSPLHAAAEHGHRSAVKLLLAHNDTDPGSRDEDDATPLHLAAERGHKGVVDELLTTPNIEAIVNLRDKDGQTPLHRAAIRGHDECVIALMDCADVNVQDQDLCTPLSIAVQEEHHKVVECLLKKPGILVHEPDQDQFTPLHIALDMRNESIVRQLLNGSGFGKTPKDIPRGLLSCATQTGNIPMLKLLLERLEPNVVAANINALDENEQTWLWSAAKRRDNGVMELLIAKDVVTLRLLVQKGEAILVGVLLEAGYNVDTRDHLGRSALHTATILGHFDIAKNLVSFGASVDCKDERGNTALRLAIKRKRCNIIDMLLESSADTTGVTTDEWLDSYDRKIPDAVHLEQEPSGKKTMSFIEAAVIPDTIRQMHNAPKTETRLILLANELPWTNGQLHPCIMPIRPNMLETSVSSPSRSGKVRFSVAIWFPAGFDKTNKNHFKVPDRGTCRITWSTSSTSNANDRAGRRSTDYFSMLSSGSIPKDGLDFFAQFLSHLREVWLQTCDLAEQHLTECRISQLKEEGNDRDLIFRLAQNARTWADLRKILKEQTKTAQNFASNYSSRYNGNQGSDEVDMLLSDFTTTIGGRLDALDQTVRDLLQLEFAWVSINDVHRSISIATSTKRLSWITFIFLPAMFTSSLFGMNVDILKDNPDWRWFFLAGSICLVSTICAWLIFKYCPIESWIEREVGQKIRRVAKVSVQVAAERKGLKEPQKLPS